MVGREGTRALVRHLTRRSARSCATWRILDVADRKLGDVPLAIQQRVEIGRALARDARVFLFDEPNSALTQEESKDLFRRMHLLADAGNVVLLVSHRIAELAEHTDRVALILDGVCTDRARGRGADPGRHRRRARHAGRRPASPTNRSRRASEATPRPACGSPAGPTPVASSRDRPAREGRRDRGHRGRRGVGRARARPLHRRVRADDGQVEVGRRSGASAVAAGTRPRLGGPSPSLFSNLTHRRQHGVPPGSRDHDRRRSRCVRGGCCASRTSCATSSGSRRPRSTCRSARCRAATSRRSPSRRRS